jgi:DNA polymerase I
VPGPNSSSEERVPSAKRLLLLDGHSLAYRAFYALPVENFSTSTGQPTNAVYGFTSMFINVVRDEVPTHVAVAFDVSRSTFRSEQYSEYKANRQATPDAFRPQVGLIREVLAALNVTTLQAEGFEADDVIATVTTRAEAEGFDVLIVTGDRDAFQLVDDATTVLYPRKGVSDLARMTPAAVEERYGLTPAQYPDYAALRGDPSDNLPGIPGVGEKTAANWIRQFGSLDALVDRVDEVKGKVGDSLRANLGSVLMNQRLTRLVRDVPIEQQPDDLERVDWDREAVHQLFDSLEFRILRDRLLALDATQNDETRDAETLPLDGEVLASADVATWLTTHATDDVGLVVDGSWGRGRGDVIGLAIAASDGAAAYVPVDELDSAAETVLGDWLASAERPKAMHDAKGPLHALTSRGWSLGGLTVDTALAAYLLRPDQRSFDLSDLSVRHLGRSLDVEEGESQQLSFDTEGPGSRAHDAMVRARAVLDLAAALAEPLRLQNAQALLTDLELPLLHVLADIERTGIAVSSEALRVLESDFISAEKVAIEEACRIIGHDVNLGSPKQLQVVIFDELGMPKTKRTKTGWTTDAEALQSLYAQTEHPFLEQVLAFRDAAKLRSTVEGLLRSVSDDERIHTTFIQTIAATGRLSSTDPNLQNVPVRTEQGRRIRQAFVAGPQADCLMTADYSQIEMRIMAHLCEDVGLIDAFTSGEDLHTTVGSRVFSVPPDQVDAEMRRRIKAMSYGLAYGLSAYGLSQQLGIGTDEAAGLMDEYFARFGGVRDYLAEVVQRARATGYTETLLGRRRYLPDLTSDNRVRREMAERMALNAPIQGSAADIIKLATLRVDRAIREHALASRMVLQVHDELVFEIAPGEAGAMQELIRTEMGSAYQLSVPLDVSVGRGDNWDEAAH